MIRIGIEYDVTMLHQQLSDHPERYFFILITDGCGVLCVKTCDNCGGNIKIHEVNGLTLSSDGNLTSVFQDDLQDAVAKLALYMNYLDGEQYPISQALIRRIIELPGFIDWIIASVSVKGRCIMFCPFWRI